MKKLFIIGLLLFTGLLSVGQQSESYWSELLLKEINELRKAHELPPLRLDEVLSAAAFDQAEYCSELGRLVHEQENEKKATVNNRVLYYEGLHGLLEENLSQISFGGKESLTPHSLREPVDTDEKLVKAVVAAWLEDEKSSKLNLLDPNFYTLGVSVIEPNESEFLFCAVFGNEPYHPLGVERLSLKNHGIEPFDKQKCSKFTERFPSLPQLFSDVIKVEDQEVFIEYHSLSFVKQLFDNSSDAIAIDWVDQRQFSCNEGTQLFPGSVAKGYLQKPLKKSFLFSQNSLDSLKQLKVNVGQVPSFYNEQTTEPNLIIIKEGVHCATIPFNQLISKNTAQIAVEFAVAGERKGNEYKWKDSMEFHIPLFPNGFDSLHKAKETLEQLQFAVINSTLLLQVSPIHQMELERNDDVSITRKHVAWDSLESFIKNTYYQLELAELAEEGKIVFLKEAQKEDAHLDKFLTSLNQLEYNVRGEAMVKLTDDVQEQLRLYRFFLGNNQIEPALFVQSKLLNKVREGALDAKEMPQADPAQKENTLAVINNQIVLESFMGAKHYGGNPIYLALFELYLINQKQPEVAFNYHIAKLDYWLKNRSEIKDMESWLVDFRKIPIDRIAQVKYARAMMNYNLLAIDYFYELGSFDKRKKSFTELMKWQVKADLNNSEILVLAHTLCYQDQFDLAIKLLQHRLEIEKDKDLLFYYLQIIQYSSADKASQYFEKYLTAAFENFGSDFCSLFTTSKMGKQSFLDERIKTKFCTNCQ